VTGVGDVLRALAELAPGPRAVELDVSRAATSPVLWGVERDARLSTSDRTVARLAALDRLRAHERPLRYGWQFVYGEHDGRPVRLPLLSMPVRLAGRSRALRIEPAGDVELTPLIGDRADAARLEAANTHAANTGAANTGAANTGAANTGAANTHAANTEAGGAEAGGTHAGGTHAGGTHAGGAEAGGTEAVSDWLADAARCAGLPVRRVYAELPPQWRRRLAQGGPYGVRTGALYLARDATTADLAATLRGWAARPGIDSTALAALYTRDPQQETGGFRRFPAVDHEVVRSPLPLNRAQREIVLRSRTEPLTVVSGPPGNGKSHAVIAAAIDAVDRGGSVLVATQSNHAADVLGDLLRRYPGPTPVLFGDAERRAAIIAELTAGLDAGYPDEVLAADDEAVAEAAGTVADLEAAALTALERERRAERAAGWEPLLPGLAVDAPKADEANLAEATTLLLRAAPGLARPGRPDPPRPGHLDSPLPAPDAAAADRAPTADGGGTDGGGATGRIERWRRGRAEKRLRRMLGAAPDVPLRRLASAVEAFGDVQARAQLQASGGTDLGTTWARLRAADAALAEVVGAAVAHRARSRRRWNADARRTVAALAAALRSGRNRRREALAAMDGPALVRALPLWVGTVADVEDLLPPVPALFDLVILDEASHLDQLRAAPALARARRALVVGDPRQLRFVSFVADTDVTRTLAEHGLDQSLDVRRNSAYDVAAGAAAATWLTDHHRSLPHLIGFSATRFYQDRLAVLTRHPRNDRADLIEHRQVQDEVAAAIEQIRRLAHRAESGIAVISPFRARVEALEAALTSTFTLEEMDRLGLRVGTVHGFQGSEADHVIVAVGLDPGDPPNRVRFVNDPNLFNVLITRARRTMTVLTALADPPGLLGEYLRYGTTPPAPPPPEQPDRDWPAALAQELKGLDLAVHPGYPVGSESVDLCLGSGDDAIGLICTVHPRGPAAHLERQRTLTRAGWRLRDAFATRWSGSAADAAITLAVDYRALP
jgi:AAA domain-containing protein